MSFLGSLRAFDGYVRARSEAIVRERTVFGALLTVSAGILLVSLLFGEVAAFLSVERETLVEVDPNLSGEAKDVRLELDILFHHLTCEEADLEVMDNQRRTYVGASMNLAKIPGRSTGLLSFGSQVERNARGQVLGCTIQGTVDVHRVTGQIYVIPRVLRLPGMAPISMGTSASHFNASHEIRRLRFGSNVAGIAHPLDGIVNVHEKPAQFRYYVQVVPTTYTYWSGISVETSQISVTESISEIQPSFGTYQSPGLFIQYEFSPMRVHVVERGTSWGEFLSSVCAIFGGTYMLSTVLDSGVYRAQELIGKQD